MMELAILSAIVAAFACGTFLGRNTSGQREKTETMKSVVWFCLMNGVGWVWASYLLAYLGRGQIAESLSQVALTEIIAVVLAYSLKSGVENLSKNNHWPDKN